MTVMGLHPLFFTQNQLFLLFSTNKLSFFTTFPPTSYYFHNFLYESVWKDNKRRMNERIPTWEILNKYAGDYKVVFVGDATMAPYEITHAGGSVEHWNEEPGATWVTRFAEHYDKLVWINPTPQETWEYSSSVSMTQELVEGKMYPLTIRGLEEGMNTLSK